MIVHTHLCCPAYRISNNSRLLTRSYSYTTCAVSYLFNPGGRSRRPNQLSPEVVLHQIGRCTVRARLDYACLRKGARGGNCTFVWCGLRPARHHGTLIYAYQYNAYSRNARTVGCDFVISLEPRERPLLTFARARITMIFWKRFSFSSHPSGSGARCADASARQSCHNVQEPATDVQIPLIQGTAISACWSVCQLCRRQRMHENLMGEDIIINFGSMASTECGDPTEAVFSPFT